MNKIYKVIWSKVRNCYVAVSEIAKRNGKSCTSVNCGAKANRGHAGVALTVALSLSLAGGGVAWARNDNPYNVNDSLTVNDNTYKDNDLVLTKGSSTGSLGSGATVTIGGSGKVISIRSSNSGNTINLSEGGSVTGGMPTNISEFQNLTSSIVAGVNHNSVSINGNVIGGVTGGYSTESSVTVTDNQITISGSNTTVGAAVHGGFSIGGDATSNTVTIQNGNKTKMVQSRGVWGGLSSGGSANDNHVVITNTGYDATNPVVDGTIYGGQANDSPATASASKNTVSINNAKVVGVYGGESGSGTVGGKNNGNCVSITDATVTGNVFGGSSTTGSVSYNEVAISGSNSNISASVFGGYSGGSGEVTDNTVTIQNGAKLNKPVYGGLSNSNNAGKSDHGNTVTITGGTITGNVYGGYVTSGSGSAINNAVDISGSATIGASGSTKNIHGGYANGTGNAIGNTVSINLVTNDKGTPDDTTDDTGVIWGTVYGGYSSSGDAGDDDVNGNSVTISNGTVRGSVFGGYVKNGTSSAKNNIITISGTSSKVTGIVYGGNAGKDGNNNGDATGNTVTISDGTFNNDIFGGYTYNSGSASNNTIAISGGNFNSYRNYIVAGYDAEATKASGNTVTLAGGNFSTNADGMGFIIGGARGGNNSSTNIKDNTVNLYGTVTGLDTVKLCGGWLYSQNTNWQGTGNEFHIGGTKNASMQIEGTTLAPWTDTTGNNKVLSVYNFNKIVLHKVNWSTTTPVLAANSFSFTNMNSYSATLDISDLSLQGTLSPGSMALLKSNNANFGNMKLTYKDANGETQSDKEIGSGISLKSISLTGTDTATTGVTLGYTKAQTKVVRTADNKAINYVISPEFKTATLGAMNWDVGRTFVSGDVFDSGGLTVNFGSGFKVTGAADQVNGQSFNLLDLSATSGAIKDAVSKSVTVTLADAAVAEKLTLSRERTDTATASAGGKQVVYTTGAKDQVTTATFNGEIAWNTGTPYYNAAGSVYTFDGDTAINATNLTFTGTTDTNPMGQSMVLIANATNISGDHITQPDTGKGMVAVSGCTENGMTYDATAKGTVTVVSTDTSKNVNYTINNVVASKVTLGSLDWGKTDTALPTGWTASGTMMVDDTNFGYSGTASTALKAGNTSTILTASGLTETGSVTLGTNKTVGMNYTDSSSGINFVGTVNGHVAAAENAVNYVVASVTLSSVDLAGWTGTGYTMAAGDAWNTNGSGVTVATENITNLPTLSAGASQPILTAASANYFSDDKISGKNKYQAYNYTPSVVNGVTFDGSQFKGVKTNDDKSGLVYAEGKMDVSTVSFGTMAWGTGRAASTADDFTSLTGSNINASNLSFTFTATDKEGLSKTSSMTLLSDAMNLTAGLTVTGASLTQAIDYAASNGAALSGTLTGTVVTESSAGVGTIKFNASSMTLDSVNLAGWNGTSASTVPAGWDKNAAGVTVATENMTNLPTLSAGATQAILTTTTANYFSDDKISATNKYQAYSYTPSVVNGVTFGGSQSKGVKTNDDKSGLVYAVGKMDVSTVSFGTMAWGTGRAASTADDFTSLTGSNINASNLSFTFTATDKEGLSKTSSMTLLSDAMNLTAGLTVTGASLTQAIDYAASNGAALSGTLTGTVVTESSAGVGTIKFNASSMTLDSVNLAGWNGTSASTVPAGWDKNAAGVTVATENMTNLPTLSAGATQAILTTTTANYFSDDKISATNKYQAYSYTPSVVNGVTFGGSQSKGVKTNDDKSGLVYAVGKMDVSTVSFGTMAWGTGRAASTADDFAGITTIDASNLSFTFSDTDKGGLSKTSSTTLLSGAANLAAGKTVTYKNSGTNYTQTINYAAGNGAALSGTLTGTVVTESSAGVGTIKFNASSMTLDSVNLAGWNGTSASTVPAGWDKNAAGVTVATENMTNLPTLSAGATQAILTTTTANYFSDDKISATNKYQAYSYTPSVVNGVTFGGSQSKGVKTNDDKSGLVYAVGKMDVSTVSFGTMAWGTGRAASTADDFAGITTIDASNLSFTFSDTDKGGLSKTSSTTLLSGAANLAAGKTVTYKNSGTNYTQTINYAAGNGAALSGTLTGTVSTTEGAASFNANSMTLDTVTLAGWDGTTTSAVPAGWDKNSAGVTVNTNSMTNLPELAAGASRDILTASSGFFTFEKIEGTNKYGNGDAFSVNLNGITVAGHELGGIKETDSGAKLTFFGEKKNVEDITLGEMAFANGGKGANLTGDYDATGATITNNLKFTEASRALMNSGSSMTIVDASAAIKNAGGNALPSFTAKNYDSTFTDSVTDQLTLTGTRRDTLTQDAAQTKLTYTVGDRVVSKAAMSGEIAWQSGDTHYANTAYTFNSSTAVDIANVKFTATDDPLNTSMMLIGNAAGVTAGNVSGSPGFTVALKNTTITATATGNASMDAGDLKYTVTGVTLDSVSVNGVGSDAIPAGWGTVANVKIDTDNMTVPADATYGSPQVIMTASSAIFTDDNITGTKKFGANPVRFTDEDNTDAVVIVGKQNAGVKASADGKSLLYEVGKKEASSVTLAKVDWAKGATVFDGSSEEYDYSGIQSLGTDSFDVAYSAPEMVAAGDNMTLLQANATLKDMAAETRSASYSFAPVSGVTIDAAVTGSLEAKDGNVTYTATENQASKLTFTNVDWKESGALMTRPSNITFAGADVDTTKIHFKNVKELDANKKMTLVSDFGDSVGTITGTKYTVGAGLEGEGAASLSGSDLVFTTKTGARDLAALAQTHNTLMVMEAGMAVLAAGNEHVGQAMAGLADPQNAGLDGTVIAASMGGSRSRYKTGSHVNSNNWNVAAAVGSKRELTKGSLEWGVFGEYGKSNYTLHSDAGRGDGDSHYAGGGLMAKWTNKHDVYTEASVRLGRLSDTANNLLRDAAGNGYGYDVHANYFGAHVGIGKIIHYKGGKSLDVYGKYFYTKRDGVDFTSGGNNYSLDSVASSILRVGARYGTTDKKWNWYGGLAYEYEFDGKSEGTVDGVGIRAASVKGGSVRGEIGLRMSATKTNPWQTDISIYGYGGKHRGFGGSVNVAYMF